MQLLVFVYLCLKKKNIVSGAISLISLMVAIISLSFNIYGHYIANSYFLYDKASKEYISNVYFENEMTYDDIQLAINEFYAVYGNIFETPGLQDYFLSKDWYMPKNKINNLYNCLENDYEKYNFKKLLEYREIKRTG